jgi:hypothetical protein
VSAGRAAARTFALLKFTELGEAEARASQAYQHESSPVAIYALSEALEAEQETAQSGGTPFLSKQSLSMDLMLTHARLAKLYRKTGRTNLSAQHLAEALKYTGAANNNQGITNEAALIDFVARVDKGAQ